LAADLLQDLDGLCKSLDQILYEILCGAENKNQGRIVLCMFDLSGVPDRILNACAARRPVLLTLTRALLPLLLFQRGSDSESLVALDFLVLLISLDCVPALVSSTVLYCCWHSVQKGSYCHEEH